ncbi:MAG: hypothetical protein K2M17_05525, partial [Bacilli bacterium]|nr:hypothetical protein [Bacilli bacterium]
IFIRDRMEDIITYVKEVLASIKNTDDLTKELVISKISKDYDVDVDILKKELKGQEIQNVRKVVEKKQPIKKRVRNRYDIAVSKILLGMMEHSDYIQTYKSKLGYFREKIERIIATEIVYYNNEHGGINMADFTSYIMTNDEVYEYILQLMSTVIDLEIDKEEFNHCIDVILEEYKKDEIKKIKKQIKEEMDINKKIELISKLTEMKKGSVE